MRLLLALPVLLAGCSTLESALVPVYVPQPIHIYNADQFSKDIRECQNYAANVYQPEWSVGTTAKATFEGATSNSSLIPISPLTAAYGAAGGLAGSLADGLGVVTGSHFNVARNCVHDETLIDRSAVVANPN